MTLSPPTTGAREFALGWPVILGAILCYALSVVAIPIYTNGVFLVELQKEFGWSRAQISLGGTLQTLTLALMSPVVGLIADRVGMRLPIAVSLVGFAVFYALLGLVLNSYAGFLILQVLLSLLGAATLPVLFTRAVNSWFDRARGLALGTTLTGTGLTATFAPSFTAYWIGEGGWRTAYIAIAVVVLIATPLIVGW
jgi:MFS family permease